MCCQFIKKAYSETLNSKICLEASFQFENLDIKVQKMQEEFRRRTGKKMVRSKLYAFPGPTWEGVLIYHLCSSEWNYFNFNFYATGLLYTVGFYYPYVVQIVGDQ